MIATVTNTVSKGLRSTDSAYSMTWFRSNFNMPVPNIWSGGSYATPVQFINESYSYDLSGFSPGFEICAGFSAFDFQNDGGTTYNVNTQLYVDWRDSSGNVLFWGLNGSTFTTSLAPGYYYKVWYACNIGCAGWEVSSSGTYHYRSSASGTPSIGVNDTSVSMSNVPNTAFLPNNPQGFVWVEGNNLCYVNASQWKHSIVGIFFGDSGHTPGYIWLDGTTLKWVGNDGGVYWAPWSIKQFYSYFSNGAPGATYGGTDNGGKIWVDNEFGQTHLAFISPTDGYKYLTGAGNYPY